MSTRRERLENKVAKREAWAESRTRKAESAWGVAHTLLDGIPLGQPMLVGHHSEKRHRNTIDRAAAAMDRGLECTKMAEHHTSRAGGIQHQPDTSIFSDDPTAIEDLRERIAAGRKEIEHMRAVNKAFRKGGAAAAMVAEGVETPTPDQVATYQAAIDKNFSWDKRPYASYTITNRSANMRRLEKRIGEIERRQTRQAEAEAAPTGVVIRGSDYVAVQFAEKPERSLINALKEAAFHWSGGAWCGYRAKLPPAVLEMVGEA